jgi:hypothetical protein
MLITLKLLKKWRICNRELISLVKILQGNKEGINLSTLYKWALENGGKDEFIGWLMGNRRFCKEMCNLGVPVSTSDYLALRRAYSERKWGVVSMLIGEMYKQYSQKGIEIDTKERLIKQLTLDGASENTLRVIFSCIDDEKN